MTVAEIINELVDDAIEHGVRYWAARRTGDDTSRTWEHAAACVLYTKAFGLACREHSRDPGWPELSEWLRWLGDGLDEIETRRRELADLGVAGHA